MEGEKKRYNIRVQTRDNHFIDYRNALYTEESWCVRIESERKVIRISKNGINNIVMEPSD